MEGFKYIRGILGSSFTKLNLSAKFKERECLRDWDTVVGNAIAKVTKAQTVRDGILFVQVKNSAWSQELHFKKPEIIEKLNHKLGSIIVKEIRFDVKSFKKPVKEVSIEGPGYDEQSIELTKTEEREIDFEIQRIKEPELKERFRKLLIHRKKVNKWKLEHGWKVCSLCGTIHDQTGNICPICSLGKMNNL